MIVDCAVYEKGKRRPGTLELEEAYEACRKGETFVWIGLHEPSEQEFDSVAREFELHELAVEDAIKAHQRPKLELYGDSLLVVLKTAAFDESDDGVAFGEILLFVGESFLVSVRHGDWPLHDVRLRMEGRADLLRFGPGAALYAIVDRVVDDYADVLANLDAAITNVEAQVFSTSRESPAARIYALKRGVLDLHAAVVPLLEPVASLARGDQDLIDERIAPYFRDVQDHLLRAAGDVMSARELLTHVLTANLTQASIRQNEDVRKISAWAAIIAVPTMVAGIYGMNFDHMPELAWTFGYPLVIAVILVACFALYRNFRRLGWL